MSAIKEIYRCLEKKALNECQPIIITITEPKKNSKKKKEKREKNIMMSREEEKKDDDLMMTRTGESFRLSYK